MEINKVMQALSGISWNNPGNMLNAVPNNILVNLSRDMNRAGAGFSAQAAQALLEEINPIFAKLRPIPGVSVGSKAQDMQYNQQVLSEAMQKLITAERSKFQRMIDIANQKAYRRPAWAQGPSFDNKLLPIPEGMGIEEWQVIQEMANRVAAETISQLNKDYAVKSVLDRVAKEEGTGVEEMIMNLVKKLLGTEPIDETTFVSPVLEQINRSASEALSKITSMAARGGSVGSVGISRVLSNTIVQAASQAAKAAKEAEIKAKEYNVNMRTAIARAAAGVTNEARRWGREAAQIVASIYGNDARQFRDLGALSRG